jgi:hypothetical protein
MREFTWKLDLRMGIIFHLQIKVLRLHFMTHYTKYFYATKIPLGRLETIIIFPSTSMRVYFTFLPNFWVIAHKETKDPPKPNLRNMLMPCHCHSLPSNSIPCHWHFHAIVKPFHAMPFPCLANPCHALPYHRISMPMLCLVNTCHSIAMSLPCLAKPCHDIPLSCSFPCLVM